MSLELVHNQCGAKAFLCQSGFQNSCSLHYTASAPRNPTCWCSSLLRLRANWSWLSSSISSVAGGRWTVGVCVDRRGNCNQHLVGISGNSAWTLSQGMQFYRFPQAKASNSSPTPQQGQGCLTTGLRGEIGLLVKQKDEASFDQSLEKVSRCCSGMRSEQYMQRGPDRAVRLVSV